MYPVTRFIATWFKAKYSKDANTERNSSHIGETSFICRPWDLDMYMEMNNGRVITLYDLGRFHLVFAANMDSLLREKGWGLAIASSTVRYRKRVTLFDKVTMRSQLAGADERWLYIRQSMWVKGQPTSSILLRAAITHNGKAIPIQEFRDAIEDDTLLNVEDWESDWVHVEDERPWPPNPSLT